LNRSPNPEVSALLPQNPLLLSKSQKKRATNQTTTPQLPFALFGRRPATLENHDQIREGRSNRLHGDSPSEEDGEEIQSRRREQVRVCLLFLLLSWKEANALRVLNTCAASDGKVTRKEAKEAGLTVTPTGERQFVCVTAADERAADLNADGRVTRSEARKAKKAGVDTKFHSLE
jgi:hypothetical protein